MVDIDASVFGTPDPAPPDDPWPDEPPEPAAHPEKRETRCESWVPPGYEPLLASFENDRPLFAAASKAGIRNATAFNLPGTLVEAGIDASVGAQTEGSNRAENAAPVFVPATVQPTGIAGTFRCTREIIDASNPAIDAVALSAMRESYARQTEARIFAELNSIQSGTITTGQVPNGAQARTSTGAALPADLRKAVAVFTQFRGRRPRSVVASSRVSVAEALETLPSDAIPAGSEDMWVVNGCGVRLSPAITGTAAGGTRLRRRCRSPASGANTLLR